MFDELTVAENIFMGHMPGGGLIDWGEMRRRASIFSSASRPISTPTAPLKQLSVAQKHMVEIARALSHEASVIIMDEPTAALSRNEIDDLFRIIAQLKAQGCAIVFISHKFDEIFRVADAYVCLRDGEMVGGGRIADSRRSRSGAPDGRPADRSGLPQARHRDRRDGPGSRRIFPTPPNSPTSPSTSAAAKFSASTASSAPGARRPPSACSA